MKAHLYTRHPSQSDSTDAIVRRTVREFSDMCEIMSYVRGETFVEYGTGDLPLAERPLLRQAIETIRAGEILYASRRSRLSSKNSVIDEIRIACESRGIELREPSSMFRAVPTDKLIQQLAGECSKEPSSVCKLLDKFVQDLACAIATGPVAIEGFGIFESKELKIDQDQSPSSLDILFTPSETIFDLGQNITAVNPWSSDSDENYRALLQCLQIIKEHLCNRNSVKVAGLGTFEIYQILGRAEVDPVTNATLSMIPTQRLARLNPHNDFLGCVSPLAVH